MPAIKLTNAQNRLLTFCARRPQQPERNCRTTRRVVELGLVSWRNVTVGRGPTAVVVGQIELTAAGRAAIAKAEKP